MELLNSNEMAMKGHKNGNAAMKCGNNMAIAKARSFDDKNKV
ncbi:hypothetical protein [Shewanella donghaensis]|nr:hypothetical protein [Shewanella donghaensis]